MTTAPTRLTGSTTPTNPHTTLSNKTKKVNFSPESQFRMGSPDSLATKHEFSIKTGTDFEKSPQVRELLSPRTLQSIENERERSLRQRGGNRIISREEALREIYDRPWLVRTKAQDSSVCDALWFPLLMVGVCLFMSLGVKYGGTTSDQREG